MVDEALKLLAQNSLQSFHTTSDDFFFFNVFCVSFEFL